MVEIGELIRHINIILSLMAIPPALYTLRILILEKKIIDTDQKKLNTLLVTLFGGVVLGAIANAVISLLSINGFKDIAGNLSIYRSIYTSSFFFIVTWSIFFFQKSVSKK